MFALLTALPLVSGSNEFRLSQDRIEEFLRILPGFWYGEAIETPLGPMGYDMHFHACRDGTAAAVVDLGASEHFWQFSNQDENLRIRFLSTFAGNRTPVMLIPVVPEAATLKFFAPEREILTLEITASEIQIDIRVFHHGQAHVHLRLTRPDNAQQEMPLHHSLLNSCRGSPAE